MKAPAKADRPRVGGNRKLWFLLGLLAVFLALMGAAFIYSAVQDRYDQQYIRIASEQQLLSQRIDTSVLKASTGQPAGFQLLRHQRERFGVLMTWLQAGDSAEGLPPLPQSQAASLKGLTEQWTRASKQIDQIVAGQKTVADVAKYVKQINGFIPQLIALSDQVTSRLVATGASNQDVYLAARQSLLAQRIDNNLGRLLVAGADASSVADAFGRDARLFGQVLQSMLSGNAQLNIAAVKDAQARSKLRDVAMVFSTVGTHVSAILDLSPKLIEIKRASAALQGETAGLLAASTNLEASVVARNQRLGLITLAGYAFGALALLMLIALGAALYSGKRRELALTNEQNRRNQRAILRLLDEMTNLAEGDLTVHATVTEDITGAIADSVNYAIDALRSLVTTINQTSVQVATASEKTQATALRLADASNHQAREIASASAAVTDMADSIEQVAGNAMNSADVAKKSVEIATEGTATVRRSIDGMNTIREQIQDTSKRIKRLGESSQEIGDIVGLINDIADQTNILALNAAIQASAAGEAGRGFAVVADEVQRLAERSANATRQIEALVKTIQADTNEAVLSMEQSTSNVVSGGQLAEAAGDALSEIEGVSNQLAQQIMAIASSARQQAAVAANVTNTMNVIQEITMQTSDGTNETAQSIGQLTALAAELRRSVAGFKLPDSEDVATFILEDDGEVAA